MDCSVSVHSSTFRRSQVWLIYSFRYTVYSSRLPLGYRVLLFVCLSAFQYCTISILYKRIWIINIEKVLILNTFQPRGHLGHVGACSYSGKNRRSSNQSLISQNIIWPSLFFLHDRYCRCKAWNISVQTRLSLSELTYLHSLYGHWKRMKVSGTQYIPWLSLLVDSLKLML